MKTFLLFLITFNTTQALSSDEINVTSENGKLIRSCSEQDLEVAQNISDDFKVLTTEVKVKDKNNCYPTRNLLYAGLSAGSFFYWGANGVWLHKTKRNRPLFHVELEHVQLHGKLENINQPYVQANTLGMGFYILKSGLYAGIKAGQLVVHNTAMDGSPKFKFDVAGVDIGWYHVWGQKQRLITGLKISSMLVPNPDAPAITLEGRGYLGFKIH